MTNPSDNGKLPYTLLLLDSSGNVVLNRLVRNPRLVHRLDEVPLQLQDRTHAGMDIHTKTSEWFTLEAKLVEEK